MNSKVFVGSLTERGYVNGDSKTARFGCVVSIIERDGILLAVDSDNNSIRRITSGGFVSTEIDQDTVCIAKDGYTFLKGDFVISQPCILATRQKEELLLLEHKANSISVFENGEKRTIAIPRKFISISPDVPWYNAFMRHISTTPSGRILACTGGCIFFLDGDNEILYEHSTAKVEDIKEGGVYSMNLFGQAVMDNDGVVWVTTPESLIKLVNGYRVGRFYLEGITYGRILAIAIGPDNCILYVGGCINSTQDANDAHNIIGIMTPEGKCKLLYKAESFDDCTGIAVIGHSVFVPHKGCILKVDF